MSVIVREPSGEIVLYCKGADNIILERSLPDKDPAMRTYLDNTINNFSKVRPREKNSRRAETGDPTDT